MLTIAYITSRRDPKFEWFLESLKLQTDQICKEIRLVIVDRYAGDRDKTMVSTLGDNWVWVEPKPCVWQGKHRLTKEDYFAASNARNTALCLTPDGHIAYVDDLSVLMPGWLKCVQEAIAGNYIAMGSYRKVNKLVVVQGVAVSYDDGNGGLDSRWNWLPPGDIVDAPGTALFGCSVAMSVEAALTVNGWPEICDGMGSEDSIMGTVLQNAGFKFKYDRRMRTLESDELHFVEPAMRKDDWHLEGGKAVRGGNGRDDKSHAALNIALASRHFPNYCDIRPLRQRVLSGEPFPVERNPQHCWYSGMALSEL